MVEIGQHVRAVAEGDGAFLFTDNENHGVGLLRQTQGRPMPGLAAPSGRAAEARQHLSRIAVLESAGVAVWASGMAAILARGGRKAS